MDVKIVVAEHAEKSILLEKMAQNSDTTIFFEVMNTDQIVERMQGHAAPIESDNRHIQSGISGKRSCIIRGTPGSKDQFYTLLRSFFQYSDGIFCDMDRRGSEQGAIHIHSNELNHMDLVSKGAE